MITAAPDALTRASSRWPAAAAADPRPAASSSGSAICCEREIARGQYENPANAPRPTAAPAPHHRVPAFIAAPTATDVSSCPASPAASIAVRYPDSAVPPPSMTRLHSGCPCMATAMNEISAPVSSTVTTANTRYPPSVPNPSAPPVPDQCTPSGSGSRLRRGSAQASSAARYRIGRPSPRLSPKVLVAREGPPPWIDVVDRRDERSARDRPTGQQLGGTSVGQPMPAIRS